MSEEIVVSEDEIADRPMKRLRWIDQARGFIMFYLVLTLGFPGEWGISFTDPSGNIVNYILHFLFEHAPTSSSYMTLFDVGAAAFIFILGLTMPISYKKREQKYGRKAAIKHIVIRYIILSIVGLLIMLINNYELVEEESGMLIVSWDVVPAIAAAGWVTFACVFIDDTKIRLIIGYSIALLYQILMLYAGLKEYALESVHGGIFGGFLGYGSISIISSSIGQYMFFSETDDKKKYKNLLIFGAINLLIGVAIAFIPGWEANKRQVSFTHNLIAIGVSVIGLWIFAWIDRSKDKDLTYLRAYGMNPFFVYFIVEVPNLLIKEAIGKDLGISPTWVGPVILTVVFITYTSIIMLRLHKNKKIIATEKAALVMIITIIILVAIILLVAPDMIL